MLQEYINNRIAEVEEKLSILQNHWDTEMKFPFSLRRWPFLNFIFDEQAKYKPLLKELKHIHEISKGEDL